VSFEIFGVALDDVLRFFDGIGNAAGLDVQLGEGGSQEFRRGIGIDSEAIFLRSLGGQIAAAVSGDMCARV
jgi:hypothetical protein